jgi:hypothetical protein
MKSPALNRVLEKTPPKSLAVLSVSTLLRADNIKLERIYGALPSHRRESRKEFSSCTTLRPKTYFCGRLNTGGQVRS